MVRVVTVGVHGFEGSAFMRSLDGADARVLVDVRQRRGVRGPEYAWANSLRLQSALADAGIAYGHLRELAPTTELRRLQYAEDDRNGVGKRSRRELAPAYVRGYVEEVLAHADLGPIATALPGGGVAALLCVERYPAACHRSLIAARLVEQYDVEVDHLLP